MLAWHASGCGIGGSAPFYDLCLLGKPQDIRGYGLGQYRDRAMLAAQAEWRSGIVVAPGRDRILRRRPGRSGFRIVDVGRSVAGRRRGFSEFTVATQNHVNLRVDYAWGKNSSALYMGVVEAF